MGFGVSYAITNIGVINSLKYGPVSVTSLVVQFSLIGATVYGLFFWNEKFTFLTALGLVLVIISLFVCIYRKNDDEKNLSVNWVLYALLAFGGNVGCTVLMRNQQLAFDFKYGNGFMFYAMLFSEAVCLYICLRGKRKIPEKT